MKQCAECNAPVIRSYKLPAKRWAKPMYCCFECEASARRKRDAARRSVYFWTRATILGPDDCWLWNGYCDPQGYGRYARNLLASRIAFELTHGLIPDGLCVLHRCDNPPCVNPRHLWLGTKTDNFLDMVAKGRGRWQKDATNAAC